MKSINQEIIKEVINFIENSGFYNKIQIVIENKGYQTETFYFLKEEGGIGHSILLEKEGGQVETIQETHMIDKDFIYKKLSSLEENAKVSIAGNNGDWILSVKL